MSRLDPLADKGLGIGFLPGYQLAQFISVVIPHTAHGTFWQWMDDHVDEGRIDVGICHGIETPQ
jgi:hypothetical protein